MARFDITGLQYFTDGGELLGGGKLNFYETGTTTRKTTYSNASMTIANTNPVTLDADGRAPNIFFAGVAKCVLTDSAGAIIETKDPVGDDSATTNSFADWAADVSYSFNQPVTASDGYIYTSLVNNNIGNDPISSPTYWQLIAKTIGFPDSPNGAVYVVDTSQPQNINAVASSTLKTMVMIESKTASNSATIDFTGLSAAYPEYEIHFQYVLPATEPRTLMVRTSTNNGVSFDATNYQNVYLKVFSATVSSLTTGTTEMVLADTIGNVAPARGCSGALRLFNPFASQSTQTESSVVYVTNGGALTRTIGAHIRTTAEAVNAIRFFYDSGNITSGVFTLYGIKNT